MITFDEDKQNRRLQDLKQKEEEDVVQILAEAKYGIPPIDLSKVLIENESLHSISEERAHALEVAPFKVNGKHIHIAVRAPDRQGIAELKSELESKGLIPHFYMASRFSIERVWDRYKELSSAKASRAGGLDISSDNILEIEKKIHTIKDVEAMVKEEDLNNPTHRISQMLEIILGSAIALNASDVHIEPGQNSVEIRFRLDGVLQNTLEIDTTTNRQINSRLKLLSGLKLTTAIAQDGRFSIFLTDTEINIRTSIIPGAYGESVVMRLLNPKSIKVKLESMGMSTHLFDIVQEEIAKPNGLILLTGPTGSGKTTTLYAFLQRIYSTEIKIITIEDPIEYHLPGITQTQVDDARGYTFLEGLRSALRQDPDIIMVGEIRDDETAKIAVESALTGHLVFSTLHTNNAAGVIPRLMDLGVNPKIIPSALSISIAQRLVRKLCLNCRRERPASEKEQIIILEIISTAIKNGKDVEGINILPETKSTIWEAVGCLECNFTGYRGRLGVFEAIRGDAAIETIIATNPGEREIKKAALPQGILTMREDGIIKVLKGITSIEELTSVVDLKEE